MRRQRGAALLLVLWVLALLSVLLGGLAGWVQLEVARRCGIASTPRRCSQRKPASPWRWPIGTGSPTAVKGS